MRSEQDDLVGLPVARDLTDDVGRLRLSLLAAGEAEAHANRPAGGA